MKKISLSTGELAKLCRIKKATLFHYDSIGLMKPDEVEPNGYRRYSEEHVLLYDLISSLRLMGTPLSEIRAYLQHRSAANLTALLQEKERELRRQESEIRRLRRLLRNTVEEMQLGETVPCGQVTLEDASPCYYIATPLLEGETDNSGFLQVMADHISYCEERRLTHHFPLGEILDGDAFSKGMIFRRFLSSRLDRRIPCDRLRVRLGGRCAVLYHRGSYDTLEQAYLQLFDWLSGRDLRPAGDVYEEDLLYYLSQSDPQDYVMRISVLVSAQEGSKTDRRNG